MMADVQAGNHQPPAEHRVRKRHRRTVACSQCRSRKLRCTREYPCERCVKNKTPNKCTYEDGFLFTSTVNSTLQGNSNKNDRDGGNKHPTLIPGAGDGIPVSELMARSSAAAPLEENEPHHRHHQDHQGPVASPLEGERAQQIPKRDHFLETVLGAPKTGDPYLPNDDIFHRSRQSDCSHGARAHRAPCGSHDFTSLSQELNVSPRIMMRGRETRTRFNGAGILANLSVQVCLFPDLGMV